MSRRARERQDVYESKHYPERWQDERDDGAVFDPRGVREKALSDRKQGAGDVAKSSSD